MKTSLSVLALAGAAVAYPAEKMAQIIGRDTVITPSMLQARASSGAESNCGPTPCTIFDAVEQLVSVHGDHIFIPPGEGDTRGPCPGLNAAANHNYLPRNGIATIAQTINGLLAAFGVGQEVSLALAAYAIAFTGDLTSLTWSIGGRGPTGLLNGILGQGEGISNSHNIYESDASATRDDAYINNGDAVLSNPAKFKHLLSLGGPNDRFTLDTLRDQNLYNRQLSEATNPYFFVAPFAGFIVAPAAHNFIVNFMSNHTAEEPSGYLDSYNLKQFFSYTGDIDNLVYTPGHERIPENWYRRPSSQPYTLLGVFQDLITGYLAYPQTLQLGGNTGTVNSFTGVDVGDLTGGVLNAQTLLEGNNLQCFAGQLLNSVIPNAVRTVTSVLSGILNPLLGDLTCPKITNWNPDAFNSYPGFNYNTAQQS